MKSRRRAAEVAPNRFAVLTLTAIVSIGAFAFAGDSKDTKTSSAPAKPAAPAAKPTNPVHAAGTPGASPGAAHTTGGTRATTGSTTTHTGPTTTNPGGTHGPTTTHPGTTTGSAPTHVTTSSVDHKPPITKSGPTEQHPTTGSSKQRQLPQGHQQINTKTASVQKTAEGRVREAHIAGRDMTIHNHINGSRRSVVERADHSRIVAERGRAGYVQHPYTYRGHEYARRSYYYHGRISYRYYYHYYYRGRYMEVYAPVRYYPAPFYGWVYNPWYLPVYYSWGWTGTSWYGYYGFYFAPAPVYPTASFWLTDYLLSADLGAAYQAQQEAQTTTDAVNAGNGASPITPDVKAQIAEEVKNQIALENVEAQQNASNQDIDPGSSGVNRMLGDGHPHVFVVGSLLDVVDVTSNQECALSDGDALELVSPPEAQATEANVFVLSSKGGKECRKADIVSVSVNDLQDMQNHMRDMIDQGMQELQTKQGTGGIPALPPSAKGAPVEPGYAQAAPPTDPKDAEAITQQLDEADKLERQVEAEAQQPAQTTPPSVPPPTSEAVKTPATITIEPGQTVDQVTAALGQPAKIIDLGAKKTYIYTDTKIHFTNGKVSSVE